MAGRNKGNWAPAFPYRLDPSLFVSFNLAYTETVIKQWYLPSPPPYVVLTPSWPIPHAETNMDVLWGYCSDNTGRHV